MASYRTPDKGEVALSDRTQSLVSDGEAIQQDPVAQQHELLVSEIESTEGHLGTALRFVNVKLSRREHFLTTVIMAYVLM
jgi:hypothetical protein